MMTKKNAIPVEKGFAQWRRDPAYVKAYAALEDEFALAAALIDAQGHRDPALHCIRTGEANTRALICCIAPNFADRPSPAISCWHPSRERN